MPVAEEEEPGKEIARFLSSIFRLCLVLIGKSPSFLNIFSSPPI